MNEITDLNNIHLSSKHKNNTHLKHDSEGVPNVIGTELLEALSAVTALKNESIAHGSLSNLLLQVPGLAGEHDRREGLDGVEHSVELLLIWVLRELQGLLGFPALNAPFAGAGLRRLHRSRRLRGLLDDGGLAAICGGGGGDGLEEPLLVGEERRESGLVRLRSRDGERVGIAERFGGQGSWVCERHCCVSLSFFSLLLCGV